MPFSLCIPRSLQESVTTTTLNITNAAWSIISIKRGFQIVYGTQIKSGGGRGKGKCMRCMVGGWVVGGGGKWGGRMHCDQCSFDMPGATNDCVYQSVFVCVVDLIPIFSMCHICTYRSLTTSYSAVHTVLFNTGSYTRFFTDYKLKPCTTSTLCKPLGDRNHKS